MVVKDFDEYMLDETAKNISEQAINLNRIEADVSKYLIDEVDKLNLKGDEKIYATMAILKNITTDIMHFAVKKSKKE